MTAKALALPGVHAVVTGADQRPAHRTQNLRHAGAPDEVVRFIGEKVAVVAAELRRSPRRRPH
jgi:CO/xanthine dehydrogenase Mo-binding subunit